MDQKKAYVDYKNTILMSLIKAEDHRDTSSSEMGDSFESSDWLIFFLFNLKIFAFQFFLFVMADFLNK